METFRMTSQRRLILEVLKGSKTHPSADGVYREVRKKLPRISLGTVYRNLEIMANQGRVAMISTPKGQRRFDYDTAAHPHFYCVRCGRIEDVPLTVLPSALDGTDSWFQGRVIQGVALHFHGLCTECLKSDRKGIPIPLFGIKERPKKGSSGG